LQKVFVEYEGVGITNPRLYKMDKANVIMSSYKTDPLTNEL
ncbi:15937_t:CDS:1, partial [Gigaspora rosea]